MVLLPLLPGLQAGCTGTPGPRLQSTAPGDSGWTRFELYFGLSSTSGSEVTVRDWDAFLELEIVPRIPTGFTVIRATGFWSEDVNRKPGREPARLLVYFCRTDEHAPMLAALREIADSFKARFHQSAVLLTTASADCEFR